LSFNLTIQFRRGTAYLWNSINPVLADGEAGFETDTGRLKIGNGIDPWRTLNYIGSEEVIQSVTNVNTYTIQKGQAIYYKTTTTDGQIGIDQYYANNTQNKHKFIGLLAQNLGQNNIGIAIYYGKLNGLDTRGTRVSSISVGGEIWENGSILYVHPTQPGKLTINKPKNAMIVGTVGVVDAVRGSIFIRSYLRGNLAELNDTTINNETLNNDNILKYNSETESWSASNIIDGGII
jgi:hypothetical protein